MDSLNAAPGPWMKWLADSLRADPGVPPGVVVMRTGIDQVIGVSDSAREAGTLAVSDELAEEYRSLGESEPYIVRYGEAGEPIACEMCGTAVALMPEREGLERPWKSGIWEPDAGRRHTLRRCEWLRASRLAAGAGRAAPGPS